MAVVGGGLAGHGAGLARDSRGTPAGLPGALAKISGRRALCSLSPGGRRAPAVALPPPHSQAGSCKPLAALPRRLQPGCHRRACSPSARLARPNRVPRRGSLRQSPPTPTQAKAERPKRSGPLWLLARPALSNIATAEARWPATGPPRSLKCRCQNARAVKPCNTREAARWRGRALRTCIGVGPRRVPKSLLLARHDLLGRCVAKRCKLIFHTALGAQSARPHLRGGGWRSHRHRHGRLGLLAARLRLRLATRRIALTVKRDSQLLRRLREEGAFSLTSCCLGLHAPEIAPRRLPA